MNKRNTIRILYAGLFLIATGMLFLFFEKTFYQYVDEQGILHESLFLPLGVLSGFLGIICLIIFFIKKFWRLFGKHSA